MKRLFFIILISQIALTHAQTEHKKLRGPVWITHDDNTDIVGLSLGAYPRNILNDSIGTVRTFGLRVEVFPLSPLYFLFPSSPVSSNDKEYISKLQGSVTQQIYGINISTGTYERIDAYGISVSGITHYSRKNNGIALSGVTNNIERLNGIAISSYGNSIYKGNGLIIAGVGNNVKHFKGVAVGLFGNSIYKGKGLLIGGGVENTAQYFSGIQIGIENYILEKGIGLQIGVFNKAVNFKGIQLGIWNKNQKRSLPFINWNFK